MSSAVGKVAKFEIVRQLKKPAFWAAILIIPVMMAVIFLISFVAGQEGADTTPEIDENTTIAITDEAGVLPKGNPFALYDNLEDGVKAVKNGEVDLYFYIPKDFAESKTAEFYHISEGLDLFNYDSYVLKQILTENAKLKVDKVDAMVLAGEYEIADNKLTADGEAENALGKMVIPITILVVFFMFVAIFGNRFLLAVVEEKENRISEMILTSVSAKHLIIGKIIAMMTLGVIQMVTLIVPVAILVFINRENAMVAAVLGSIEFDPVTITMNVLLLVAASFFYAGTCMFIGTLTSTARDASSFIGPAIIAMVFPLYFMQAFLSATPGFMVYFLSYFPLSAPIALMLRSGFGTLGTGEFMIGLMEVSALAVVMIMLAVRTFQKNAINFSTFRLKWPKKA